MTPDELNTHCIDRLAAANLAERVAIIGSGPSSPYIAPISKLQELLTQRCGVAKSEDEYFWNFAERAHDANTLEYFAVIRETYEQTPYWSADVYLHLTAMPFKAFATFNYDDQLPKAFRNRYPQTYAQYFSVYPPLGNSTYFAPLQLLNSPPRLIALHGYCDPQHAQWETQAILRTSDYNQHYGMAPALLFDWWRNMLLGAPCLFVGTSLHEPGLQRVVEYLLSDCREQLENQKHLHLMSAPAEKYDANADSPKSLDVIEQVYYDRLDSRYSGLLRVLSVFSNLPIDRPSPRVPALKPITPTDTFQFTPT